MTKRIIESALLCLTITLLSFTTPTILFSQNTTDVKTDKEETLFLQNDAPETIFQTFEIDNDTDLFQSDVEVTKDRNTTSLTVGYIDDEFLLETDQDSERFYFVGETAGAMISGKGANLMFAYGSTDAARGEGDIRSLSGDLHFGGNVYLFRNFMRLPVSLYVPIRLNVGYRNLSLIDEDESLHLAQAGIGAGAGASVRIPTGLPVVKDNITGFASLVRSVGGMGDISSTVANQAGAEEMSVLSGMRLMQNTDLNIEAKFERLLGDKTGVTVGLTIRWQSWTEEKAGEFLEVLDVVTGQQENLIKRGKQTFLRLGINW